MGSYAETGRAESRPGDDDVAGRSRRPRPPHPGRGGRGDVRVKESVARREARLAAMTDEQLANVALTMVFIAYGGGGGGGGGAAPSSPPPPRAGGGGQPQGGG